MSGDGFADLRAALARLPLWGQPGIDCAIRANFRCEYCGRDLLASLDDYKAWAQDHVVPRTDGGGGERHHEPGAAVRAVQRAQGREVHAVGTGGGEQEGGMDAGRASGGGRGREGEGSCAARPQRALAGPGSPGAGRTTRQRRTGARQRRLADEGGG